MYRVLVPIDANETGAERAARAIVDLPGDPTEIEAVILNVFEAFEVPDEGPPVNSEDFYDESKFPDSARIAAETLETAGADVTLRREHGDPADEILAVADEIDADSIVMSGRQRSPAGKVLFGSVTQSVLISTERPVTVVMRE